MTDNLRYHRRLDDIVQADLDYVRKKDAQYNASWKKRGGVGAWFTVVRPMDRLENMVSHPRARTTDGVTRTARPYDILECILSEGLAGEDGTVLACVRDLRRYFLLIEAEATERLASTHEAFEETIEDVVRRAAAERGRDYEEVVRMLSAGLEPEEPELPGILPDTLEGRRKPVVIGPGTPEDGGHHATDPEHVLPLVMTGEQLSQMSGGESLLYGMVSQNTFRLDECPALPTVWAQSRAVQRAYIWDEVRCLALLDRRCYSGSDDYFVRLPHEVNGKEFLDLQPEHQMLYEEPRGSDSKRCMRPEYLEAWSRT